MRELKISDSRFTNITTNSERQYINEVAKIPLLTIEEEVELAKTYQETKDELALNKLIRGNLRFVISVAKQLNDSNSNLGELINEGNYGLIIAAQRYDCTKGFKFISYAVWWIRSKIMEYKSTHSRTIRIPTNQITMLFKILNAENKIEVEQGRKPSAEEISKEVGIPKESVEALLSTNRLKVMALDEPLTEDGGSLLNLIENENADTTDHLTKVNDSEIFLKTLLSRLTNREKYVIINYFGLFGEKQINQREIGDSLGITKSMVGQIYSKARRKMRYTFIFNKDKFDKL
jgi:RNA polymerase primary sigma factor